MVASVAAAEGLCKVRGFGAALGSPGSPVWPDRASTAQRSDRPSSAWSFQCRQEMGEGFAAPVAPPLHAHGLVGGERSRPARRAGRGGPRFCGSEG